MTNCSRLVALGAVLATLALATPAAAAPVAATPKATAKAQIVKPIVFKATANLNFGTIVLSGIIANTSVTIAGTAGAVAVCGNTTLVCSGTSQPAIYNVQATLGQPLTVRSAASNLSLVGGGATPPVIVFTPAAPATVTVTNATTGADFVVGGSIVVTPITAEGVYIGDMDVTVDYN